MVEKPGSQKAIGNPEGPDLAGAELHSFRTRNTQQVTEEEETVWTLVIRYLRLNNGSVENITEQGRDFHQETGKDPAKSSAIG